MDERQSFHQWPIRIAHGPPKDLATPEPLISLANTTVGYEGNAVLHGINMTIHRGDFMGIVGPSGSGKTALLRTILGQIDIYTGDVKRHLCTDQNQVRIGYVTQVETVDWDFPITVEQVVLLGIWKKTRWHIRSRPKDRQLARDILKKLSIEHLLKRPIRSLSGGQQQRVFLARALISNPDLLLLDEPTSGVDIRTRHEIMHLLSQLNHAGITVVIATHDLNTVATHLPRLACIGNRGLIADGKPEDVLTPEVLRKAYGADMLVLRRGEAIYVVDDLGETISANEF